MKVKRKNTSLLLGNGPNRSNDSGVSWHQVLQQLALFSNSKSVLKNSEIKPFPLLYEELAVRCVRNGKMESDLKKRVAILMKEMAPNGIHGRIANAGFKHIMTTNYDYCLETAANETVTPANIREENRYNLFRRRQVSNTTVWHIHGEIDKPRTITLGHDHYVGYLQKIKEYLVWERKNISQDFAERHSPFMQKQIDFDHHEDMSHSWVDVFLRDDIHIFGFGLDYSEIDLWWLLIFKEKQKLKARKYTSLPAFGATWFYNIYEEPLSKLTLGKLSILESIGVQIINIEVGRGYERAYHTAFSQLIENAQQPGEH